MVEESCLRSFACLAYARRSTTVPTSTQTLSRSKLRHCLYAETTIAEVKAVERRAAQWTTINDEETITGKREKGTARSAEQSPTPTRTVRAHVTTIDSTYLCL